jgi:anthranilate/para-aminobenzoate synthase component I
VPGGGGITADSDPAAEYDETVAKVRGVLAALAAA